MRRQRIRKKETKMIFQKIREETGIELKGELERVEINGRVVYLLDNEPIILEYDGRYYLTVYGVMKFKPAKGRVVVDEGALKFIINGADVMKPGIVEADTEIKEGDFCYVVVEKKLTPLAVGIALVRGEEMTGGKGKAVKNIHHIDDKIWKFFFKK
uniref:DUF1947 domain-containing protein n=1 Tax=Geoglobus ahangari TaxID=113653 RepID=A0A7C4S8F1_9EURY